MTIAGRLAVVVAIALLAVAPMRAQVTFERLLRANKEPQNWLTYSGSLFSHRYTTLTQITPANVKNLELQWVFQTRGPAEDHGATLAEKLRAEIGAEERLLESSSGR